MDYYFNIYNGNEVNSWFVEPGGFLKLRELTLRYDVPARADRAGGDGESAPMNPLAEDLDHFLAP